MADLKETVNVSDLEEMIKIAKPIYITIEDQNKNRIGEITLNGVINEWSEESGATYVVEWGENNDEITIRVDGDFIANQWIDELDDEEDLMCLDWEEYDKKEPYFVDKDEIEHIFEEQKKMGCEHMIKVVKLAKDRYEVDFNGNLLYFICPLNAREEVKKDWKELKWLFKEYE